MRGSAIAASLGLGGLDGCVARLAAVVGGTGVERVKDLLPVVLEGLGHPFDGYKTAAAQPLVPKLERRFGGVAIGRGVEDRT